MGRGSREHNRSTFYSGNPRRSSENQCFRVGDAPLSFSYNSPRELCAIVKKSLFFT